MDRRVLSLPWRWASCPADSALALPGGRRVTGDIAWGGNGFFISKDHGERIDLAIVIFEDLQCPDCARAHPELLKASEAIWLMKVLKPSSIHPYRLSLLPTIMGNQV